MTYPRARYSGDLENTTRILINELQAGDILLVLSAGDADLVSENVLATLKEKEHG
jgi:UDP-N-acetylmuramate-alanine ligase